MSREHDEWVARHFGVDPSTYEATDPDPDLNASVDPNAGQPNASTAPEANAAPMPESEGGMTAVTADGAPYSAPGNDGSGEGHETAPAGEGTGGMTGVTPEGAPYSTPGNDGSAGDVETAPTQDGAGGMTGTTADGAPFSAPGNDGSEDGGQSEAAPPVAEAPPADEEEGPGFFSQLGTGLKAVGSAIGDGLHEAGQAIGRAVDAVEDKVVETFDDTVGAVATGIEDVGNVVSPPQFPPRGLNGAERSYAGDIFFSTLDYGKITVSGGGVATWDADKQPVQSRTIGNTINLAVGYFNPDGTLTDAGLGTLVHEMAHVWQFQHSGWSYVRKALVAQGAAKVFEGDSGKAYDWERLDAAKVPWGQWNPEAQAQSIEDYNTALRAANSGSGTSETFRTLERLQPYVDQMVGGAKAGDYPAPEPGKAAG